MPNSTLLITGYAAIAWAREDQDRTLCKYADPAENERSGLSISEALEVADQDPNLIWTETDIELLRCELGGGGWSLHADDDAHTLLNSGDSEPDNSASGWARPNQEDWDLAKKRALEIWTEKASNE